MERELMVRLFCVAGVAAVMLPLGHLLFPLVSDLMSGTQFQAIEAVIGASVGFAISAIIV